MLNDDSLNDFQRACELELRTALETHAFSIAGRMISCLIRNPDLHGHILETGLEFWIYEDGADYSHGFKQKQRHYERLDFPTLDELRARFVRDVLAQRLEARRRYG